MHVLYYDNTPGPLLQVQIGNSTSRASREVAQAVGSIGLESTVGGRRARRRARRGEREPDLAVVLSYQTSKRGRAAQARLTEASRKLADAVGGYQNASGGPVAPVFDRLADIIRRPGIWLLRRPLTDDQLANVAGTAACHSHALNGV